MEDLICPFCGEGGFDLFSLQMHLKNCWCPVYGRVQEDNTLSND